MRRHYGLVRLPKIGKPAQTLWVSPGYRTSSFAFDGIAGQQREYTAWLLQTCAAEGLRPGDLAADEAVELMAAKLRTPLQIERHLTLPFSTNWSRS